MNGIELPPGWQPEPPAAWPALGSGPLAIVFMLHTPELTEREFYALETLRRHGEDHPRFLLVPEGMRIGFAHEDFRVVPLPAGNFASRAAYNAMSPAPNRAMGGAAASADLTRMWSRRREFLSLESASFSVFCALPIQIRQAAESCGYLSPTTGR